MAPALSAGVESEPMVCPASVLPDRQGQLTRLGRSVLAGREVPRKPAVSFGVGAAASPRPWRPYGTQSPTAGAAARPPAAEVLDRLVLRRPRPCHCHLGRRPGGSAPAGRARW